MKQDGAPAHTARATQNWLQTNCPCRFHCQRPVASKFTRLELLGLPCLGATEAYHKRHPKPKTIAELKEVLQVIWDSIGTNRQSCQACQRVLKATECLCCSSGWTFRTFTVTAMSRLFYFCLNDVILLRDCLDILSGENL